jgi:hypothetical protein
MSGNSTNRDLARAQLAQPATRVATISASRTLGIE